MLEKIGIVGFGFVGQALYKSIKNKNDVVILDPDKGYNNPITDTDILFICVGTPENDFSSISSTLDALQLARYDGIVVVKSTVPHEFIKYPGLKLVLNPEFLDQRTSHEDFKNQKYIVLGGDIDSTMNVENFYFLRTNVNCKTFEHCTIKEASDFKYTRNILSALNVLKWNYIHELTGDSRKMLIMMSNLPLTENGLVGIDGELGYGGACFPKDVNSMHTIRPHKLTKFMKKYNKSLMK